MSDEQTEIAQRKRHMNSREKRRKGIMGSWEQWTSTYPELEGKPELLAQMAKDRSFRMMIFWGFNLMFHIPHTPDKRVAGALQAIAYEKIRNRLDTWKDQLEDIDIRIYGQAIGAFRDLSRNVIFKISGRELQYPQKKPTYNLAARGRWKEERRLERIAARQNGA